MAILDKGKGRSHMTWFNGDELFVRYPDEQFELSYNTRRHLKVSRNTHDKMWVGVILLATLALLSGAAGIVFHSFVGFGACLFLPALIMMICAVDQNSAYKSKNLISKALRRKITNFNEAVMARSKADRFIRNAVPEEEYNAEIKSWTRQRSDLQEALDAEFKVVKQNFHILSNRNAVLEVEKQLARIENCKVTDTIDYSRYVSLIRAKEKLKETS